MRTSIFYRKDENRVIETTLKKNWMQRTSVTAVVAAVIDGKRRPEMATHVACSWLILSGPVKELTKKL